MKDIITKFYVIPEIPYDYLIGRRLQAELGLVHGSHGDIIEDYLHESKQNDDLGLSDKFERPICSGLFPLQREEKGKINIDDVRIDKKELAPFIKRSSCWAQTCTRSPFPQIL